jgi:hypothetical protein
MSMVTKNDAGGTGRRLEQIGKHPAGDELDSPFGRNANGFTRLRISSRSSFSVDGFKAAESGKSHSFPVFERIHHTKKQGMKGFLRLIERDSGVF